MGEKLAGASCPLSKTAPDGWKNANNFNIVETKNIVLGN